MKHRRIQFNNWIVFDVRFERGKEIIIVIVVDIEPLIRLFRLIENQGFVGRRWTFHIACHSRCFSSTARLDSQRIHIFLLSLFQFQSPSYNSGECAIFDTRHICEREWNDDISQSMFCDFINSVDCILCEWKIKPKQKYVPTLALVHSKTKENRNECEDVV